MNPIKQVKVGNLTVGGNKLTIVAGPCVLDTFEDAMTIGKEMKRVCEKLGLNYIFKASFDKANRTSITSFRGPGLKEGLMWLSVIGSELGVPTVTDIHEPYQAELAAEKVDLLQIPAFLCRQTDLLRAASQTGKPLNIKKAQFMAPEDMATVVNKCKESGNDQIILCERGTCFGYHALSVDMRSLPTMRDLGCPVMFDATHSVQKPSAQGGCSGGDRSFVMPLARAAAAVGVDSIFLEVHPNPEVAKCDGPNSVPLALAEKLLAQIATIDKASREIGFSDLAWSN
ncbi:MAG: 3-deoxy-8-phosphooctulonate synthase [Synergistaceae bacterium]|nr:3-deoxy-8-phosphooctulonate synthase [Synergistaceae bacterium]